MKERLQPPDELPERDEGSKEDEAYDRWRDTHEEEWEEMRSRLLGESK
jgi:hypothetical protein